MVAGAGLFSFGPLLTLAAAFAPHRFVLPLLIASGLVAGFGLMVYNINQVAIRQALIPDHLLGRASGGAQLLSFGAQVTGSLLGGLIGQHAGLPAALALGTIGTCTCVLTVLRSPVRSLREVPRLDA
jgi:MFS family permease